MKTVDVPTQPNRSLRAVIAGAIRATTRSPLVWVLLGLVAVDLFFAVTEVVLSEIPRGHRRFSEISLRTEGGLPELYGQLKLIIAAALLVRAGRSRHGPVTAAWVAILTYAVIDDRFIIHERLGGWVADGVGLTGEGALRGQDIGELIVFAVVAIMALQALLLGERLSPAPSPTELTKLMTVSVGLLAFFAVVVDPIARDWRGHIALEDGGELVAQTVVLMASLVWWRGRRAATAAPAPPGG